ncbi:pyridoxal-dependent decarboxylase [Allokutzneria sp. A3M-2-11 16]|uniref:pyridoxal phosphate-dependent decarboxylase family protein n=1 Tax=Allokutzneria sp. A3M-2-11 16 TaxID=2962043 RepID=UPI0020B866CF|nr:pyridoxal-dependent decarboxylase [Allokutzneria sp. A3M-2-11 16]MCP3801262.1 pyridoxal-dependent decarboxylase [Allokutzneria sp. A3M-2-11 16]
MSPAAEAPPRPRTTSTIPLAGTGEGLAEVAAALARAVGGASTARRPSGPLPAGSPQDVLGAVTSRLGPAVIPATGVGADAALYRVARLLVEQGIDLTHPFAAAHLQPPPLAVAVAADALAGASNASQDTYDSGPAGIAVERWLVSTLANLAGFEKRADGVLTPGGSLSNLMAIMLARDTVARRLGIDIRTDGVAALGKPVVFCSELAHFSTHRACAVLGLGEAAVRAVPVDADRRMRPDALVEMLAGLNADEIPLAVVATAGTTDFGSVDPLPEICEIAREHGMWFHADAAYGYGALFSDRLASKVAGLQLADSITVDLHKIGWQPSAASVLLVADGTAFTSLERQVDYLNPADDGEQGYDGLLGVSLQTTRRPDAVKVATTLLAYGRTGLGSMLDTCHDLALHAEARIRTEPELELVAGANLTTVVFRYRGSDELNGALRRELLRSGQALLGRTSAFRDEPGSPSVTCLKFTLLNPNAGVSDIDALIDLVISTGRRLAHQEGAA